MPAHIPNRKTSQIRVNEIIFEKTKVIAKLESRNTNAQIEYFMKQGVEAYEKQHGVIELSKDE